MLSDSEAQELLTFLTPSTRPDVKGQATEYVLGLSGTREGCRWLRSKPHCLRALVILTSDPSVAIAKDCFHALINLSADETLHRPLVDTGVLPMLFQNLLDPEFMFSDRICTVLTNLSRHERTCRTVLQALQEGGVGVARLVEVFCTEGYNQRASLHYLGPLLSNLTQLPEARQCIMDRDRCVVQRLLPYTQYEASPVRRGGVIGTLRNCCFDYSHHEWLLSDAVDILPFLLLPLAGPEELSDEENEGLPVDLQYLPETKKREEDPDIRKMLLETLLLLTATKLGRETLRKRRVYPITREFHRWEKEPHVAAACEKLIHVLIGDEPEAGMENLMEVEIPEEVELKLQEARAKEEEELEKEKADMLKAEEQEEEELEKEKADMLKAEEQEEEELEKEKADMLKAEEQEEEELEKADMLKAEEEEELEKADMLKAEEQEEELEKEKADMLKAEEQEEEELEKEKADMLKAEEQEEEELEKADMLKAEEEEELEKADMLKAEEQEEEELEKEKADMLKAEEQEEEEERKTRQQEEKEECLEGMER